MLTLADLLDERCVLLDMHPRRKKDAIEALVNCVADAGYVDDPKRVIREVLNREKMVSTGIGRGAAIPHRLDPRIVRTVMAFGRAEKGVAFDAIDGEPVRLFFLILGPDDHPNEHLRLLSRLSRLLHRDECVEAFLSAKSAAEIRAIMLREEAT